MRQTSYGFKDDVTIIVVDVVPSSMKGFHEIFPPAKAGGLFACMKPPTILEDLDESRPPRSNRVENMATVDFG